MTAIAPTELLKLAEREVIAQIIDPECAAALNSERKWCEQYGKNFETFAQGYILRWERALQKADVVIARQAASVERAEVAGEAVAWRYEMAHYIKPSDAEPFREWKLVVTTEPPPSIPEGGVRNVQPLGVIASPPRSEGVRGCEVPDYDAAAIALGFARLNTGTWVHPNDDAHFPRRFETAQEIFEKCNPQTMEATRSEVRNEDADHVRSALETLSDPLLIKVEKHLTGTTRALGIISAMRNIAQTALLHLPPVGAAQGYEVCGELLFRCAACGTQNSFGPIENAQAIVDCGDDDAIGLANLIEHNCKQREYNLRGTASRMGLIVAALRSYAIPSVPSAQQSTAED